MAYILFMSVLSLFTYRDQMLCAASDVTTYRRAVTMSQATRMTFVTGSDGWALFPSAATYLFPIILSEQYG